MAEPTLFDEASLALIASGGAGKDGKAYSIKPTDGTGDFTFSRGSNLAATRVGPTGLIEKGRENLILQSNQFDTTWATIDSNVTSGQSGYDGSSNAWELDATTAGGRLYQNISYSGVHTFSIYAKKGTADGVRVRFVQTGGANVYIDLRDGTLSFNPANTIDVDIQDVSNGWYRITFALNAIGTSILILYPTDGTSSQVAGSIYIQDTQLEIGLAATDYIESGATTGKAGLLENEPRFDYSGGVTCPSLLLEPSRTNLINYSEYFGSGWSLSNISATYNYSISPEGLKNATLMSPTTNDAFLREMSNSFTSGGSYTASIYMKSNSGSSFDLNMRLRESGGGQDLIETKTITTEWQRFEISITATITGNYQFWIGTSGTWSLNEDLLIWGAQLEAGSYPTSYIPNHSGGSVTRGADDCDGAVNASNFNDSEGVLYAEISALANDGTFRNISVSNGTTAQAIRIYYRSNDNQITFLLGSSSGGGITTSIPSSTEFIKVAAKYDTDTIKLFINGAFINSVSSLTMPTGLQQLDFNIAGVLPFYGNVKQVLVFKEALSDTELIKLTTI